MKLKPLNASIRQVLGGGAFGIGLLAFAPMAAAELQVLEVQPVPIDAPEQLIIWGTDFNNPMVKFGTYPHALAYSADQSLCPGTPAPPLDNTAVDCIVVDLPVGTDDPPFDNPDPGSVPAGDYLLSLWQETAPECAVKPSSLTFMYEPSDCSGTNSQPGSSCSGDMTGSAGPATLSAPDANQVSWVFSPNPVGNGVSSRPLAPAATAGRTTWT
ncbi:MAG: hypothetical protein R3212_02385 [Xanthomonadales bacterium]|nr:hypothetical protein [Xanthomonadales bacterium]